MEVAVYRRNSVTHMYCVVWYRAYFSVETAQRDWEEDTLVDIIGAGSADSLAVKPKEGKMQYIEQGGKKRREKRENRLSVPTEFIVMS